MTDENTQDVEVIDEAEAAPKPKKTTAKKKAAPKAAPKAAVPKVKGGMRPNPKHVVIAGKPKS